MSTATKPITGMQRGDRALVQPFVSIVTITKDNPSELERTIESVAGQTFRDYEHIIVDSSAAPGLLNNCVHVVHWPATGIANAFNRGIQEATGRYVLFLNAGDTLVSSNILCSLAQYVNNGLHPEECVFYGDWYAWYKGRYKLITANARNLWRENGLCHQALIFPLSTHKQHLYDERLSLGMDYDVYLRINNKIPFVYVGFAIANFFYGGISFGEMPSFRAAFNRLIIRGINHPAGPGNISGMSGAFAIECRRAAKEILRSCCYRSSKILARSGWQ
jgi:putative colanic acid biosynthesis glycosyltransferase